MENYIIVQVTYEQARFLWIKAKWKAQEYQGATECPKAVYQLWVIVSLI